MRVTLAVLAVVNLFLVLVLLPIREYALTSSVWSRWADTEKSLVESGQLVFKPADPAVEPSNQTRHIVDGWLFEQFALPILNDEADARWGLTIFFLAQTVLFLVLAWLAGRKCRGVPGTQSVAPA